MLFAMLAIEVKKACIKSFPALLFPCHQPTQIMSDKFALYRNQSVLVLGIEENEALISFDDGHEEYVSIETIDFL